MERRKVYQPAANAVASSPEEVTRELERSGTRAALGARTGTALGVVAAVGMVPRELWSGGAAGWGTRHDGQAAGAG
eukprot:6986557-Prymnesium_polylepis.1